MYVRVASTVSSTHKTVLPTFSLHSGYGGARNRFCLFRQCEVRISISTCADFLAKFLLSNTNLRMDSKTLIDRQKQVETEEASPFVPDQNETAIKVDDFKGFLDHFKKRHVSP